MRDEKAKQYSSLKVKLTIVNLIYTFVLLGAFLFMGWSVIIRDWAESLTKHPAGVVALYFLAFSAVIYIFDFPLKIYSSFFVEHQFGLSTQSLADWFRDEAKKQVIMMSLALALVEGFYWLLRSFPDVWWLYTWVAWVALTVLFGELWPVLILPLFHKCTDIADESLRTRILSFMERENVRVQNISTIDLSRNTKKANAAFCGLGKAKRILLGDTLLSNFTHDEIEVVLAHELGHYKRRHILKNIAFGSAVSLMLFALLKWGFERWSLDLGFRGNTDIAAFPLLNLVVSILGLVLMPIQNSYSRLMEREADDFAMQTASNLGAFVSSMEKLATLNLADRKPNPVVEFFLYSHPSIENRIQRQQQRHVANKG